MNIRSSWFLLIAFLLLGGISWYLISNNQEKTSMIMADRDFAIKDIDQVEKIFLAGRNQAPNLLEKRNGIWYINNKYKAAVNPVKNLLTTIRDVRMQSIPSKGHVKGIMEGMAVYGIKVEIYGKNDKLLKTYYVGGATQQEYGTYFYMEHGNQPYIMEIPHFVGNIRERYDLDEIDWRDRTVFDFELSNIESVSLHYPHAATESFIIRKQENEFALFDYQDPNKKIESVSPKSIKKYLQNYEGIGAQDIQNANPKRGEIVSLTPYAIIEMKQIGESQPTSYKFYPVNVDSNEVVNYNFDPNNMNPQDFFKMHIDRSNGDFLLVQYPNFKSVLINKSQIR